MPDDQTVWAKGLVGEVAKRSVRGLKSAAQRAQTAAFVRSYYERVPEEDIRTRDVDDLAGQAVDLLAFARKRAPGRPLMRIFSPDKKTQGWSSDHTVIEIINDNMPFLVDSVTAALNMRSLSVHLVIHPVIKLWRDKGGTLKALSPAKSPAKSWSELSESFIHVEIDRQAAGSEIADLRKALEGVLGDVRVAVRDWLAMRHQLGHVLEELTKAGAPKGVTVEELDEVRDFLKWLDDDHYTFLGYRRYDFTSTRKGPKDPQIAKGSGLGVLHDPSARVFYADDSSQPRNVQHLKSSESLLTITKANRRSTVHRPIHMDTIGIRIADGAGRTIGEHRFVGLFTSHAYSLSPRFIPLLRRKIARTVSRAGFDPSSHDGKAFLHILETYPRDELFQISEEELTATALGILHLHERQRTALFTRRDPFGRFISCLVFTPKDVYSATLRERFGEILCAAFSGTVSAFYTQVGDDVLARIQYIIKTDPAKKVEFVTEAVERDLAAAARSWADELHDILVAAHGERDGVALFDRYRRAFPQAYQDTFSASQAVLDADKIEEALGRGRPGLNLYRRQGGKPDELRLKIYQPRGPLPLSDALPMLENMGLRVIEEIPFRIAPKGTDPVWVHDFGLIRRVGVGTHDHENFARTKLLFEEAFEHLRDGTLDDDGFNQLVLAEQMGWRDIVLVRAYSKYLRQIRAPFSQEYMIETFIKNPGFAQMLVDLFAAKFDPANRDRAESREVTIKVKYEEALDGVASLDEDRILRRFLNLVLASLRTNHYQLAADGGPKPYLSIKLASGDIEDLPLPRPWREIWVYSPRMEGIHLRGGPVARGGIRWSDRREDFRTEILGLMKAQTVKNPVIVPVGAKGGFVVKNPPTDGGREALQAEGIECYKTLMRGLLDITDNRVGDRVTVRKNVVRHDDDDPYLVVAADKGTATFSDIANGISREYGHWLDDAFASGGSVGYDHKKMGITARGAWESVKRHFREMGKDIQKEDFTVVGVGDMAGDVFGNGMLLSPHIKLVAAFNHMHVFLDPDPDPTAALKERRRLFNKPRSSWADYDAKLISKGGGVYERRAKSVPLSAEVRALLGVGQNAMSPDDLIRAILLADIELLWFGGIGTFVKSSEESNADAGDRANDAVRVDGAKLRCKVVGEGANLGVTQAGRIEYARAGGRINTDSIDNSAGVDCSDHEVNIKILLGQVMAAKKLSMKARDKLLADMTGEVSALVLRDNYLQTQALSVAEAEAAERLPNAQRLIRALERTGRINRAVEGLPNEEEVQQLLSSGLGLTRPELSVLLAFSKLALNDELIETELPDEPLLERDLVAYFPTPIQKRFPTAIPKHRLNREIIVTAIANLIVNRAGPTFVNDLKERTGLGSGPAARGFLIVRDSFGCDDLWQAIEALDNKVPAAIQTEMLDTIKDLSERAVLWLVQNGDHPLDIAANIDHFRPGVEALGKALRDVVSADDLAALDSRCDRLTDAGVPAVLARRVASLTLMNAAFDVVSVAGADHAAVPDMARVYFGIGTRFGFDWLRAAAQHITAQTTWQRQAVQAMIDELYALQHDLVVNIVDAAGGAKAADAIVSVWADSRKALVARTEQTIADMQAAGTADVAMLAVALRQLRVLVSG